MIDLTISFTGNYVHEPLSNSFKSSGSIIAHARNERCDRHWQVNGSTCSRSMNLARLKNQKKINGQNPCNESRYQVEERSLTFPDKNSWLSLSLSLPVCHVFFTHFHLCLSLNKWIVERRNCQGSWRVYCLYLDLFFCKENYILISLYRRQ